MTNLPADEHISVWARQQGYRIALHSAASCELQRQPDAEKLTIVIRSAEVPA